MPSRRQYITHRFGGGWATAFGPSAEDIQINGNVATIPWLNDAENVVFGLDGAPRKIPGLAKVNSTALESGASILGVYDYWKQGVGGSPSQRRVLHCGTKIYEVDSGDNFTELASGLVAGAIPNYSTFDDFLIIASDSTADAPRSWDQTTFQNLAGSPPNFSFSTKHKAKVFAAGVVTAPSTLYYTDNFDPENWSTGDSGTIQISPGDGDQITGMMSHKSELFVFKGPHKGSIWRITGSSNSDFAAVPFVDGVGAVWQNSIFPIGDDIGFLWSDGSIRSLAVTDKYGDYSRLATSVPIQNWIDDHANFTRLRQAWAKSSHAGQVVYLTLPTDSSTTNNAVIVIDYRFDPVRLSLVTSYAAGCLDIALDPANSDKPTFFFGGYDGFLRKQTPDRSIDTTTAISYKATTPFLTYSSAHQLKTLEAGSLGVAPKNNGNITFAWTRDDNAQQTLAVSQTVNGDVLAPASANQFTLGTSTLGGASFVNRWFDLEEGGDFRSISYQFTNSVNYEDVDIHTFGAFLNVDAVSTEN